MIMIQDYTNSVFEILAGFFVLLNCREVIKDKSVKGVNVVSIMFFTIWGIWNLYYYPFLEQWMSFVGGLFVTSANAAWIILILIYKRKEEVK